MKTFYLILSFVLLSNILQAQPPGDGPPPRAGERIEALYIAYITRALSLTSAEAEKFWPIHMEFDEEMKKNRRDQSELDRQQSMLDVKKKYEPRFEKVIGKERTDEFYRKDMEFRKKMVERLKQSRQRPGGPGGGN